jgi:hypothetical protein
VRGQEARLEPLNLLGGLSHPVHRLGSDAVHVRTLGRVGNQEVNTGE